MRPSPLRATLSGPLLLLTVVTSLALLVLALPSPAHAAGGSVAPQARAAKTSRVLGWVAPNGVTTGSTYVAKVRVTGGSRAVALQRRVGSSWRTVGTARTARSGRATVTWRTPASAVRVPLRLLVPRAGRRAAVATGVRYLDVRSATGSTGTTTGSGTTTPGSSDATLSPLLTSVLSLVNDARATGRTCGGTFYPAVPALRVDGRLNAAAAKHAAQMASRDFFSHTGLDGTSPGDRITAEGYVWRSYGENIAAGQRTASEVVTGWLKSAGHCRNIMGRFAEIGLGYAFDATSPYGSYWVQDFGTR